MGSAMPRFIAATPAIKVVLTAPRPTSNTPSFPFGCSIDADALRFFDITRISDPFLSAYSIVIGTERWEGLLRFFAEFCRSIAEFGSDPPHAFTDPSLATTD